MIPTAWQGLTEEGQEVLARCVEEFKAACIQYQTQTGKPLDAKEMKAADRVWNPIRCKLNRQGIRWSDFRTWALAGLAQQQVESVDRVEVLDKKRQAELEPSAWISRMVSNLKEHQALRRDMSTSQDSAVIRITTDRPVAIGFSADWHLGAVSVDYGAWQEDVAFTVAAPDFYLAAVGDLVDNFPTTFPSAEAVFRQGLTPREQRFLLEKALDVLGPKLLFATWGNHDVSRDERMMGDSPIARLLGERVPYLNGQGLVRLRIGPEGGGEPQEYTVDVTHSNRFKSMLNETHSAMRQYERDFPADIVATAHLHNPAGHWRYKYTRARGMGYPFGGLSILLQCGTYNIYDTYAARNFAPGMEGVPTVVLYPDRHEMVPFQSAHHAMVYIAGTEVYRGLQETLLTPGRSTVSR